MERLRDLHGVEPPFRRIDMVTCRAPSAAERPCHDEWLGHANLVEVGRDGRVAAASGPRSDGSAVQVELPPR